MIFALRRLAFLGLVLIFLLSLTAATRADDAKFRWADGPQAGTTDLLLGDQPVARYMALPYDNSTKELEHDTYKVYHHVFAPDGKTILTKGPGGQYTHHRGLYCAWNKTSYEGNTDDFWHCTKGASQRHVKFLDKTADAQHGAATVEIHWADAEAKPVIIETRSIDVRRSPTGTTGWQIDWRTNLASQRGEIKLEGDRQHAGFQYRAAQIVSDQKSARFIRQGKGTGKRDREKGQGKGTGKRCQTGTDREKVSGQGQGRDREKVREKVSGTKYRNFRRFQPETVPDTFSPSFLLLTPFLLRCWRLGNDTQ